ncbi:hypothetical protein E2C01_032594 [Portunus trituberculatus]|uniref:Uncharacterized protein n=1 Tax=Portunus trituberculatus TaxID=210409 RepID=A0A5B7F381_PORTR|nr:hypothetical protein [Portunus trituberculatus]
MLWWTSCREAEAQWEAQQWQVSKALTSNNNNEARSLHIPKQDFICFSRMPEKEGCLEYEYGSSKNKKSMLNLTPQMLQYTSSHHPPPPPTTTTLTTATPQPTTSHAEQRQGNEEEKASFLTIREALLQNIEEGRDVENDNEIVMLMKKRLKNLLSSCYSCPDPAFDYSLELDVYENTITLHCTTCNFKNTSQPEKVRAGRQKKSIFRTNISLTGGTRSLIYI